MDEIIELKKQVSSLKSKSNSWDRLDEFFRTNKDIQKYHRETVDDCIRDNYYGVATMMVITMEKLLEKIDDLEEEIDCLEDELKKK